MCAAALFGALCAPALADVDPYYSGALDTATGEAVTSSSASTATRVRISESMYYDREYGAFAYPTGSGVAEVRANVADGMIVNEPVSITAPDGVEVTVLRNGEVLAEVDLNNIAAPGSYTVVAQDVGSSQNLFGFTIVGASTNLAGGYQMPEGFYILDATLNEEDTYYERGFIGMEDEGLYHVEYVCADTSLHYALDTIIDRTPPELTFDGRVDNRGRFRSAVQIGGLEDVAAIAMTRDGESVTFPSDGRLTEAGLYQLQAWDSAGNSVMAQFTMLMYLDANSLIFFALLCVSLAGVLGYILYKRKKLKIV